MGFIKNAIASAGKNANVAWNFMHSTPVGASYARWMAAGAVIGGVRGLADNIVGQDRTSVVGGAIQGAIMGGAMRGVGHLWNTRGALMSNMKAAGLRANAANQAAAFSILRGSINAPTGAGPMQRVSRPTGVSSRGRRYRAGRGLI